MNMDGILTTDFFLQEIETMRKKATYKTEFRAFAASSKKLDSSFVDEHFSFFSAWELGTILSVKQMNEEFLEKHFDELGHDKIAMFQRFSEDFFIKHFSEMDANIVLGYGKNDWRKKDKRSRYLDVFLRLKGVKI